MKTISKRILCLIVVVCICCSVLPQIFGVMADATEPELSSKCETVIDIAGKDGSFGEDITDLRTSTSIKFSSAINLSDADIFELNVYIEDIEALKSAITETQYIQFGFSSSSRRATANHAEVDISSQLTQSGWNNICVNKSDFTETNINWNNIYYVFIRFANESIDLSTALTNKVVKIRNICESVAVPLSEGADVTLYDAFLNATLGESADSLISSVGETFKVATSVTDFTDVSLFNVDLYIPNISSFESFIADKELRFVLSSEQGSASCKFSGGYSANSIANWYTVKLKTAEFIKDADFDITKVNEFKIEIIGNENEKLGSAYSLKFGFANVHGIKIISPENSIYGETLSEYIVSQQLLSFGETYADFNFEKSSDYSALGDCENIELDLYVDNYESFINSFLYDKNITSINASLDLILSNGTNTLTWKGIERLIKKSGWNHIILSVAEADNNGFDINSNFSCINLNIADVDSTLMNPNCDGIIAVDNMVATKGVAEPQLPDNIDNILIEELNVNYGKDLPLTFDPNGGYHARKIIDTALDLSSADYIEFDIYVSDAELLKAYDNLYLSLYPSENGYNGHRADFDFKEQLKNDGWNHIKVKKTSARSRGATGSYPYSIDWTNISAVALMTYQSGAPNVTETGYAVIKNVCSTIGELSLIPDLPENVVTRIVEDGDATLGAYFGYTWDRLYKQGIGPYDFSKCNTIEFDIYIDDYELLKQALACERGAEIAIVFSSTPQKLFSSHDKPRQYYSEIINITDQIVKTGWNHIKLSKLDFNKFRHTMDWSNVTSWMIHFPLTKLNTTEEKEVNPAGDLYVKVANICNTGILADVPYDEKQEVKPDKTAVYINDAESLVDDNGSWNPSEVYVEENYKTENSHSVLRELSYLTDPLFARMFYLFDYSADMSDIKTLKFDLFIDLPQFIQKEGNVLEIGLSSERNFSKCNYQWQIDTYSLKEGWNSLEFDISSAKKNGNLTLDSIKTIYLNFSSINLSSEEFESIVIGIDNLRYISSNGNTSLKINGNSNEDSSIEDMNNDYNDISDDITNETNNSLNNDSQTIVKNIVKKEPKTIHLKETINQVTTDYNTVIVILCCEFVLLTAASVIAFIFIKKKSRKNR